MGVLVCPCCGSGACLRQSPRVCRHTNRLRPGTPGAPVLDPKNQTKTTRKRERR